MEMCPSGCCRGKSGLLAYSVSSIYISTVSGIWSIYSLGYLHNIWWTADTGSGQGDLVHALSDNLHPSWLLVSNGLCIQILLLLQYARSTTIFLKICQCYRDVAVMYFVWVLTNNIRIYRPASQTIICDVEVRNNVKLTI